MAITLLDELALEKDPLRKGIIQSLVEQVMLQDRIPWESAEALHTNVTYLAGIPTVPLRHINETPTSVQANWGQLTETLQILDTDIDIDPVLMNNKNQIQKIDVAQVNAIMKSIGYRMNDLFINADPMNNAREPKGMKTRLRDDTRFKGQTVNATADANELDLTIATGTDAERLAFLDKLDELMYLLEDHCSAFISNRQARLRFWSILRTLKLLDTTKDQFEREITIYRGVPLLDAGYKPSAAVDGTPDPNGSDTNQIIGNDADNYGAGGDPGAGNGANAYPACATVYAVRWGDDYCKGLQQEPLRTKSYGETEDPPHFHRTNVRWVMSPCVPFQKRSVARLVGVSFTNGG